MGEGRIMAFIKLTTDKGLKTLVNTDHIEGIIDVSNNFEYGYRQKLNSEVGKFSLLSGIGNNGGQYVQETYEEIMATLEREYNILEIRDREPDIVSNKDLEQED